MMIETEGYASTFWRTIPCSSQFERRAVDLPSWTGATTHYIR